jgi:hypothetical protein
MVPALLFLLIPNTPQAKLAATRIKAFRDEGMGGSGIQMRSRSRTRRKPARELPEF